MNNILMSSTILLFPLIMHAACPDSADAINAINKYVEDKAAVEFKSHTRTWKIIELEDPIPGKLPYQSFGSRDLGRTCEFTLWPNIGLDESARGGKAIIQEVKRTLALHGRASQK